MLLNQEISLNEGKQQQSSILLFAKVIVMQVKSQFDFYLFISGLCWFVVRTKAKYLYDQELVIEFEAICVCSEIFYSLSNK